MISGIEYNTLGIPNRFVGYVQLFEGWTIGWLSLASARDLRNMTVIKCWEKGDRAHAGDSRFNSGDFYFGAWNDLSVRF